MSYVLTANTPPPIVVHLDSQSEGVKQLESGLTTNFIYSIAEPIIVPDHMNILISLHTATIPYSFYNIRSGVNNIIGFVVGAIPYPLTLEEGNYSAFSLLNLMKNHLEAHGSITTATISYTRETLKFKFNVSSSSSVVIHFPTTTAGDLLGLTSDLTISSGEVSSHKAVDLNDAIHGLYVRQNLATKGTLDTSQGIFSNILARIPITTNAGGIIFFTPSANQHETMISVPLIQTIGIRLTDDKHRTIDLNGLHFQLSIKLSYIHKEELREVIPRLNRVVLQPLKTEGDNEEEKLKINRITKRKKKNKS